MITIQTNFMPAERRDLSDHKSMKHLLISANSLPSIVSASVPGGQLPYKPWGNSQHSLDLVSSALLHACSFAVKTGNNLIMGNSNQWDGWIEYTQKTQTDKKTMEHYGLFRFFKNKGSYSL